MADDRIRIDELPPEITATLNHLLAAMESGETVNLTVKQVLDLFLLYPQFTGKADISAVTAVSSALTTAVSQLRTRYKVRAATTANVTIATALNAGDTIDGVVLVNGDLVLVKAQTTASQNGVYVVGTVPARSPEFATFNDHVASLILISEGTVNAGTLWQGTALAGGTLNTTSISFVVADAATKTALLTLVPRNDAAQAWNATQQAQLRTNIGLDLGYPLLHVVDEKNSATDGGSAAAATIQDRNLNTIRVNEISGASLAANVVTLPEGTYWIEANTPAFATQKTKGWLAESVSNTIRVHGTNEYGINTGGSSCQSLIMGRLTVPVGGLAYKLRTYTEVAVGTNGLGVCSPGSGQNSVYSQLKAWKLK